MDVNSDFGEHLSIYLPIVHMQNKQIMFLRTSSYISNLLYCFVVWEEKTVRYNTD